MNKIKNIAVLLAILPLAVVADQLTVSPDESVKSNVSSIPPSTEASFPHAPPPAIGTVEKEAGKAVGDTATANIPDGVALDNKQIDKIFLSFIEEKRAKEAKEAKEKKEAAALAKLNPYSLPPGSPYSQGANGGPSGLVAHPLNSGNYGEKGQRTGAGATGLPNPMLANPMHPLNQNMGSAGGGGDFVIKGVSCDGSDCVIFADGGIFKKGDILPTGETITSIGIGGIRTNTRKIAF